MPWHLTKARRLLACDARRRPLLVPRSLWGTQNTVWGAGNLYAYPWAYGDYVCLQQEKCQGLEAKVYIGLESLLVESANYNTYKASISSVLKMFFNDLKIFKGHFKAFEAVFEAIPWGADDCVENLSSLGAGSYCAICREASLGRDQYV